MPVRKVRGTTTELQEAARSMRRAKTPGEAALWAALRRRQLGGLRFRQQHPVGPFILDFYCPEHKLVVEVDGAIHDGRSMADANRTVQLESYGCRGLRFRNEEVLHNLDAVLECILRAAASVAP